MAAFEGEEPEVVEVDAEVSDPDDGGSDQPTGPDEEATVDLEDDDLQGGQGDLFDYEEDSEREDDVDDVEDAPDGETPDVDGDGDDDDEDAIGIDLEGQSEQLEAAINDGVARMAVIGLSEEDLEESEMDRSDLETEFAETFGAFRLGHFGAQWAEEYVLKPADGDVDPTWGLLGAGLMCAAMIVWLRPDGEEAVSAARTKLGDAVANIGGTAA